MKTKIAEMPDDPSFTEHPEHATWKRRMAELEASGLTTSDAQCVCDIEWLQGKLKTTETSAPKHIACPTCGRTNQDNAIACWRCSTPIAKHRTPPTVIMDEDDARRDLRQLCQEQQEKIATLTSESDAWRADSQMLADICNLLTEAMPGFKGVPSTPEWTVAAVRELLEQRRDICAAITKAIPRLNGTTEGLEAKQALARVNKTLRES